jgi:Fe-S cluster assembly protein SufB
MLEWPLKAFRHWPKLEKQEAEPKGANIKYDTIDYQDIIYYSGLNPRSPGRRV